MPLFELGQKLCRVPSLSAVMQLFEDGADMTRFIALVDEYVPENKATITGYPQTKDKVASFFQFFSEKYFPLYDGYIDSVYDSGDESLLANLLHTVPIDCFWGFSDYMYHEFADLRICDQLLLALMRSPYDWGEGGGCHQGAMSGAQQDGERIPILESAAEMVGADIVKLIPERGWKLNDIRKLVDGTKFSPVCDFLEWVSHDTGNGCLDSDPENEGCMEPIEWDKEYIEDIAKECRAAKVFWNRYHKFADWFEEDAEANFTELVKMMHKGKKERVKVKIHV